MKILLAAAAAALALTACSPVIEGGPPISLPVGLQESAQIGTITMSSGWLNAEDDFADTFNDEVHEELRRCMWGAAPVCVLSRASHVRSACLRRRQRRGRFQACGLVL